MRDGSSAVVGISLEDASDEVTVVTVQVVVEQEVAVQDVVHEVTEVVEPLAVTCVRVFELGVCAGGRGGRY